MQVYKNDYYTIMRFNNKNWILPARIYKGLKFTSTGTTTIELINNLGTNINYPDIKYSLDNGDSWTQWDYSAINLNDGDIICFKGYNPDGFSSINARSVYSISGNGTIAVSGNIMSLLDDGACNTYVIPNNRCFTNLFVNATKVTDVTQINLAATTLNEFCYVGMFVGTSITAAPKLPASNLAKGCYNSMFQDCSLLLTGPDLNVLSIPTIAYANMFRRCSSLQYIKCLATQMETNISTQDWVEGVTNTNGTFVKNPSSTIWAYGTNGVPTGWTIVNA